MLPWLNELRALTMLLSQYSADMIRTQWAGAAELTVPPLRVDVSCYSAKVMSGIGFLLLA